MGNNVAAAGLPLHPGIDNIVGTGSRWGGRHNVRWVLLEHLPRHLVGSLPVTSLLMLFVSMGPLKAVAVQVVHVLPVFVYVVCVRVQKSVMRLRLTLSLRYQ
jgi:hypothetical protein